MSRRSHALTCLALGAALALTGCAAAAPGGSEPPGMTVEFECVLNSDHGEVFVGETITVSRGSDGACQGLNLGSTQLFEFRSNRISAPVKRTVEVEVAEDGSFAFEVVVPADMRIGLAVLQPVPAMPVCAEQGVLDCPPPSLYFTVSQPQSELRDLTILDPDPPDPPLPDHPWRDAYVSPGPEDGQLTVLIIGNGCRHFPASFVATAPSDTLSIVSGTEGDACDDMQTPWTSVIEVPDSHAGFTSVTVDNMPAEALPAEG